MMDWIKEYRGTHRAYDVGREVAVVQGSGFQGWRFSLRSGQWDETFFGSVVAAKKAAEKAYKQEP